MARTCRPRRSSTCGCAACGGSSFTLSFGAETTAEFDPVVPADVEAEAAEVLGPEVGAEIDPSDVDCDDVNTAYDLKGHTYFRSGRKEGDPGLVFEARIPLVPGGE